MKPPCLFQNFKEYSQYNFEFFNWLSLYMTDLVSVKFIWFYFMYLISLEHFKVVKQRKLEATT